MLWKRFTTVVVLLMFIGATLTCSKSMWGSRRKKEQESTTLQSKPKITKQTIPTYSADSKGRSESSSPRKKKAPAIEVFDDEAIDNVRQVLEAYLKIVEELLESDDFSSVVNHESIMTMMSQFPGYADKDQLQSLFSSPEFKDPDILKKTVRDGVHMLRVYSEEILSTFKNPMKFSAFLEQLPPEMVELIRGLKNGDTSILLEFIDNLPGIEDKQRSMLKSLLNGDTQALTVEINSLLGDPDKVEALRLEFLQDPEMAEAVGISADVVKDPQRWAAFFAEGLEELSQAYSESEVEVIDLNEGIGGSSDVIKRMRDSEAVSEELKKLRKKMHQLNRAA